MREANTAACDRCVNVRDVREGESARGGSGQNRRAAVIGNEGTDGRALQGEGMGQGMYRWCNLSLNLEPVFEAVMLSM